MAAEGNDPKPRDGVEERAARKRQIVASDILRAFDFACELGERDVAERLLGVLEDILVKCVDTHIAKRRRDLELLTRARERMLTIQPSRSRRS
jgi:triphosphoribosyl-dephospho-CoA synthetase